MSMRSAASCGQPLQESARPRGAWIGCAGRPVGVMRATVYSRRDTDKSIERTTMLANQVNDQRFLLSAAKAARDAVKTDL